jgi:hypothetical protein
VVEWHIETPCQPTVQVLPNADLTPAGGEAQPCRYDLRERTDLMIAHHDGCDVRNDNFRLTPDATSQQKNAA